MTSIILGYSLGGTPINGVAPKATVIPVKVLNQTGSVQKPFKRFVCALHKPITVFTGAR